MDADAFALLTGAGVKFDRRRFNKDIQTFAPKHSQPISLAAAATAGSHRHKPPAAQDTDSGEEGEDQEEGGSEPLDSDGDQGDAAASDGEEGSSDGEGDSDGDSEGGDSDIDPGCPQVSTKDPNEEANVIRKHYRIKVSGQDAPAPLRSFKELDTKLKAGPRLLANIVAAGFSQPTPIQRQAIPCMLAGRELLAVAPTGSGKTLAFVLPVLVGLRRLRAAGDWPAAVKAVLLSPTHELAAQQARCLKLLLPGTGLRCSLLNKSTAAGTDFSKVDVLLANPLRLAHMAKEGKMDLKEVRYLVLDEADKLFELGFMEQIDEVVAGCSRKGSTDLAISSTLPQGHREGAVQCHAARQGGGDGEVSAAAASSHHGGGAQHRGVVCQAEAAVCGEGERQAADTAPDHRAGHQAANPGICVVKGPCQGPPPGAHV